MLGARRPDDAGPDSRHAREIESVGIIRDGGGHSHNYVTVGLGAPKRPRRRSVTLGRLETVKPESRGRARAQAWLLASLAIIAGAAQPLPGESVPIGMDESGIGFPGSPVRQAAARRPRRWTPSLDPLQASEGQP